jgi:PAS domain S-box-containing protein
MRDHEGELTHFIAVKEDITERKATQKAIEDSHDEIERLLSSISSILIGISDDGRVTRWNKSAESAFGMHSVDIMGHSFRQCHIKWDWDALVEKLSSCREKAKPVELNDFRYTRRDGKEAFIALTINPVLRERDADRGFLILGNDITERKQLEGQLSQAQKLESIGRLAAGIAHEINTPIQYVGDNVRFLDMAFLRFQKVLAGYGQLLAAAENQAVTTQQLDAIKVSAQEAKIDYLLDEIPKAVQETLGGVERVANIVRAMKEFSHPGSAEKVLTDINKALQNTVTVASNEWKYVADLQLDLDASLSMIPCLPGELNQVFLNMIVNAAHAIEEVSKDGNAGKGVIKVSTACNNGWAVIRIADSGAGIPEKLRSKIFDPFFTSKSVGKGTGQGLAIANNIIVDKHSGKISFESEVGKGTTFLIQLPTLADNSQEQ